MRESPSECGRVGNYADVPQSQYKLNLKISNLEMLLDSSNKSYRDSKSKKSTYCSGHPLQATGGGNEIWKKCLLVGEMK